MSHRFRCSSSFYSEGVFTRYPYSRTLKASAATAYACVLDFIRAHHQAPSDLPNNFEEYCRAHFGNSITERFMIPYNRRLWGRPREITTPGANDSSNSDARRRHSYHADWLTMASRIPVDIMQCKSAVRI